MVLMIAKLGNTKFYVLVCETGKLKMKKNSLRIKLFHVAGFKFCYINVRGCFKKIPWN